MSYYGLKKIKAQTQQPNPDTTISLKSDSTWRASRVLSVGWEKPGFDDGEWIYATAPSRGTCGQGKVGNFEGDPMWLSGAIERETVYFRKKLIVGDTPKNARIKAAFDDDGEIYINGSKALSDWDGKAGEHAADVTEYLRKGENTIALVVKDSYGICQSAAVFIEVKIPFANKYELNMPPIKQSTLTWAPMQYAGGVKDDMFCGITIGDCGCVITSLAMLLTFHGVIKGPDGFNTRPIFLTSICHKISAVITRVCERWLCIWRCGVERCT
ncbi:MAG: hypothetical protein UZ22_OP11002001011 [Microgenomates bacterium OLB23]|nr:MAG: hypothetical protein UZ22_OP11002001011 [Microgenomates bacterium OLB23]